jgi:hypothetical protein
MALPNDLTQRFFEKEIAFKFPRQAPAFLPEAQRQLMKGQKLHVEKRETALAAQENFQAPAKQIRWDENQERGEQIGGFIFFDLLDECVFEIGVKRSQNRLHDVLSSAHGERKREHYEITGRRAQAEAPLFGA